MEHTCETGFYGISRNIIPGIRLYTTTPTSNAVVSDALTSMLANFGKPNFQTRARVGHFHLVYNKRPDVRVNRLQACPIWELGRAHYGRAKDVETSGRGQTMRGRVLNSGSMLLFVTMVETRI